MWKSGSDGGGVRIRRMEPADLDEVVRMEEESFPTPWSRNLFEKELASSRSRFFVLEENGHVAAYAGYWEVADEAHIVSLAVSQNRRRRGLGRFLLGHILKEARARGLRRATLEVRADSAPAIRLYEGAGFRPVAMRPNYYPKEGRDAWVMMREL